MAIVSKTFSSATVSGTISVKHGETLNYTAAGTFDGSVQLEKSDDGGLSWYIVAGPYILDPAVSGSVKHQGGPTKGSASYRWNCLVRTTGSVVTTISDALPVGAQKKLLLNGAKAGATSGFVVNAADNISLITCPASKTASTLVVPIQGLNVGDKIVGFNLVGQIESAGNGVTVDAALRKHTAAAADVADAAVASMTQVSVTADAALSVSNSQKLGLDQVVAEDESYYLLITATTGASTDIALQGVALYVVPA